MSDLQIVLVVLGVFIIAGVIVYNWFQEKKLRENITEDFIVPQKDVLIDELYIDTDALVEKEFANDVHKSEILSKLHEGSTQHSIRTEPGFSNPSSERSTEELEDEPANDKSLVESSSADAELLKAIFGGESASSDDGPETVPTDETTEEVEQEVVVEKNILPAEFDQLVTSSLPDDAHSQIDLTAFMYATKHINARAFDFMMHSTLKELGAFVMIHGLNDHEIWQPVNSETIEDTEYRQIACSIQLADRRGPVSKSVLNKFQFAVETIGLEFNAQVEWQGKGDPSQRAIDLDKFCMDVDQLVSVHLIQGDTPIHGTKFKGLAEANDLKLKHGKFCSFDLLRPDSAKFVLINADEQPFTPDSLRQNVVLSATFQMEIPKVINCEEVFDQMVGVAKQMASSLNARLVDDNQKPLGDLQIEKIRQQLKVIHAKMIARGIMPGSAYSMRLFN